MHQNNIHRTNKLRVHQKAAIMSLTSHSGTDREIIAKFSQNYRKIIALISPLETAVSCEIIDGIFSKLSQNYRTIFRTHFPIRNCRFFVKLSQNYRTSALYKLLDRSLKKKTVGK